MNLKISTILSSIFLVFSSVCFAQSTDCKLMIGTNLGGISDWMTEMPFVDMMRNARTWGTRNQTEWIENGKNEWNTELADSIEKDENGYPLEVPLFINNIGLEDSQIIFTVWATIEAWEAGVYTLFYDGEGEIEFGRDGEIIAKQPGQMSIRITPSTKDSFLEMKILRSKRGNHIRNIRLIMPGHESTYTKQPFNPLYLEKLQPFKALRFMDWGNTNNWGHDNAWTCYDNQQDTMLARWNERSTMTNYTWATNKGTPYEIMCDLCNTLNKDMWVCVPYCASAEYIQKMAKLIKERLNPGLKIYAEYSNENWNWMFGQTQWLNTFYGDGIGKGWPEGIVVPIQRNLDIWTEVFADKPSRLIRVVGVQTAWQDVANRIVLNLKPGSYDAIALTGYFGLSEEGDAALDQLGTKAKVKDVAYWVRKEMSEEIGWIKDDYKELSSKLNVPIIYYEAGQHITPTPFGEEPTYAQALLDIQRDTTMYNLYKEWFGMVENIIPKGEQALYMNFSFISSRSAQYGSWGLLEALDQDTTEIYAPKYSATLEQISKCNNTVSSEKLKKNSSDLTTERIKITNRGNMQFVVLSETNLKEVQLFDLKGRRLMIFRAENPEFVNLDMSNMPAGFYLLKIKTEGFEVSKKLSVGK